MTLIHCGSCSFGFETSQTRICPSHPEVVYVDISGYVSRGADITRVGQLKLAINCPSGDHVTALTLFVWPSST